MSKEITTHTTLKDVFAPSALKVESTHIQLGDRYARTLFVFSYPRFLGSSWFNPVINADRALDVAIYITPVDTATVLRKLRKKTTEVESQLIEHERKGLVRDPILETAHQDLEQLRDRLQTAQERLFRQGLYITLYARSPKELDEAEEEVKGLLEARLVLARPALFQHDAGFLTTLPTGQDHIAITHPMNSAPLSTTFPFVSADLSSNQGILYGINRHNNSLVLFDRFELVNANMVVFGTSGAGKTLASSVEVLIRDERGSVAHQEIGSLIEALIVKHGARPIETGVEGVLEPGIQVYTFDKHLRGKWSNVSVAARKTPPETMYVFCTRSGREIEVTGDHNMLVFRNGFVTAAKSKDIKVGEVVPIPRIIPEPAEPTTTLNLLDLLRDSPYLWVGGCEYLIRAHYTTLKSKEINPRYDQYLNHYRRKGWVPMSYFQQMINHLNIPNNKTSCVAIGSKQHQKTTLPTYLELGPAFLRLLGYIVSEGTVNKRLLIISNTDKEVIADIRRLLQELGIGYSMLSPNRGFVLGVAIRELVRALGLSGRAGEKRVPQFIFNVSNDLAAEFLRGYFEGDGGAEEHAVTATSKSKGLVSDLAYLLLRFGIVSRIAKRTKHATNSGVSGEYWLLTISGQEALRRFKQYIGFVTASKNQRLTTLLTKNPNTNVDTIPVASLFHELHSFFGPPLFGLQDVIDLKNNAYQPSRDKLQEVVVQIEARVERFLDLRTTLLPLADLPQLQSVIAMGILTPATNGALWAELGYSWQLMKTGGVLPRSQGVFRAIHTLGGPEHSLQEIKHLIHIGCKELGISIKGITRSLQSALVDRPFANTDYGLIHRAAQTVWQRYEDFSRNMPRVLGCINRLKQLVSSDLFWDPIVSIKKVPNADPYVYDLMVDNQVFLAGHGGMFVHNSYFEKLEILRSVMTGTQVYVIDPENEYQYLADTVDGAFIKISLTSSHHINPFDLPQPSEDESPGEVFRSNVSYLVGLLRIMLGGLTPQEDAVLDRALIETYASRDITPDADFSKFVPPTLADLKTVLQAMEGTEGVVARLEKYTTGTYALFLNQQTNVNVEKPLVVFNIRDLEDELRPIAMYMILHYIWNIIRHELKRRLLVVDEAWLIMKYEDGASFLLNMAKRARKYYLGLTTITQDIADFMKSKQGVPIVTNAALQLLLKQSPATIETVTKTFNLTEAEKLLLLETNVGEGILVAGLKRAAIKVIASYTEDQIITSDPAELLAIKKAKEDFQKARGR